MHRKVITYFAVSFIFVFSNLDSGNCQQVTWQRTFGGLFFDLGQYSFQTNDGGFLMVGGKSHLYSGNVIGQTYLVKLDFNGNVEWERAYGDSIHGNGSFSAIQDDLGNYYVPYFSGRGYLMKLDSKGNILWNRSYGDSIAGFYFVNFTDNNRNLILTGGTYVFESAFPTASLTKIDTSGNCLWSKSYHDTVGFAGVYYIGAQPKILANAYYFTGRHRGRGFIVKTDVNGNLIWAKDYSIVSFLSAIIDVSDNTFISSGYHYCQKTDSSGNLIWQKSYGMDTLAVWGTSIAKTFDNNLALVGSGPYGFCSIFFIDTSGNNINNAIHYYEPQNLLGYSSISACSDSGYIITGDFRITDQHDPDALIVKSNSSGKIVSIINNSVSSIPDHYSLSQNFPNPFNPSTVINYQIPFSGNVKLTVYDLLGQEISTLVNEFKNPGSYAVSFNGSGLTSGVYFYKLAADGFEETKKMVIVK